LGPQAGIGRPAVADWRLAKAGVVEEERPAAAAPPRTTERAKTRTTIFMKSAFRENCGWGKVIASGLALAALIHLWARGNVGSAGRNRQAGCG